MAGDKKCWTQIKQESLARLKLLYQRERGEHEPSFVFVPNNSFNAKGGHPKIE